MATLFVQDPPEVAGWLAERRAKGLDGKDEVWEGVHHVAPHEHARNGRTAQRLAALLAPAAAAAGLEATGAFNLGAPDDVRVPDLGYHPVDAELALWMPTAALVVEVLSPGDETWQKLPFYAARGVQEVWVVDPLQRTVRVWQRVGEDLAETGRSDLLRTPAVDVQQRLAWP